MHARTAAGTVPTPRDPQPAQASWLAPLRRATWREWLLVLLQMVLVAGIELADDAAHALDPLANAVAGLANALRVMEFERAHGFWIEPGIQRFFASSHTVLGQTIGWAQVQPIIDALYGEGHAGITFCFALWVYFWRRSLFALLRNVFVLTNLLAVALYELFPLAPPRLATGLTYQGQPVHFLDAVFGGNGGVQLSFNEYAAMPSLHVAWALIVGLTLAWAVRPWAVRLLSLVYPLIMSFTVIVSGNHYIVDALGAAAVVSCAALVSVLIAWRQAEGASLGQTLDRLCRGRAGVAPTPSVAGTGEACGQAA